jgi:protein SCO1
MKLLPLVFLAGLASLHAAPDARAGTPPRPSDMIQEVAFDPPLGNRVPLDAVFRDENGRPVPLRDAMDGRTTILTLVYYECPMLCSEILNALLRGLRPLALEIGKDFNIVTVSFDPAEGSSLAAAKKAEYVRGYKRPAAAQAWRFLTGDAEPIRRLTEAAGFRAKRIEGTGDYAHAGGVLILTPDGKISRALLGVDYAPKDLKLALMEASGEKIGTLADRALLLCYQYDPITGRYGFAIKSSLRAGGALTLLVLGGFIGLSLRREKSRSAPPAFPARGKEEKRRENG